MKLKVRFQKLLRTGSSGYVKVECYRVYFSRTTNNILQERKERREDIGSRGIERFPIDSAICLGQILKWNRKKRKFLMTIALYDSTGVRIFTGPFKKLPDVTKESVEYGFLNILSFLFVI